MSLDLPYNNNNVKFFNDNYRSDARNPYPGIYRARVEYTADERRLKRVKVRIPQMHGIPEIDEDFIPTRDLPWAVPKGSTIAGYDMGSYIVPKVGSMIWIEFEAGDPNKFVYGGGIHGKNSKEAHQMGLFYEEYEEDSIPAGQWDAPVGENEIPKDAFDGKSEDDNEPTRDIIHKSLKGHTIMMDDEDEKESLSIIDRAGQIFKMISPLKDDKNHTGDKSFQRGVSNSIDGDQKDYEEESYMSKAVVIMKDLAGQIIRSVAEFGKEKMELVSRNKEDNRQTVLEMNSGEDNINYFLLSEDKESGNKVYIKADAVNTKLEFVVVEGETEISRIEMSDYIKQYSSGTFDIQSIDKLRVHSNNHLNISADDGSLEIYSSSNMNVESGSDMNIKSGGSMNRQAGSSISDKAGGTVNHDGSATHLQSGTSSSASSYGGDVFDYSQPSDKTTWEDKEDEKFIEE